MRELVRGILYPDAAIGTGSAYVGFTAAAGNTGTPQALWDFLFSGTTAANNL